MNVVEEVGLGSVDCLRERAEVGASAVPTNQSAYSQDVSRYLSEEHFAVHDE